MREITFPEWIRQFEEDDSDRGMLARDIAYEITGKSLFYLKNASSSEIIEGFNAKQRANRRKRWKNSFDWIKNHLEEMTNNYEVIKTFEEAWRDYEKFTLKEIPE